MVTSCSQPTPAPAQPPRVVERAPVRVVAAPIVVAEPAAEPAPNGSVPAWQSFAVGPANLPSAPWAARTVVGLTLHTFDGTQLTGTVNLHGAPGLDGTTCAVEILWDVGAKQGARLTALPVIAPTATAATIARWRFTVSLPTPRAAVSASAYVFCPLNNAHVDRPWGVSFSTGETSIGGPDARAAYCKRGEPPDKPYIDKTIEGHTTFQLSFSCGALIRLRGRQIIDECRGDVLVGLDALAADAVADRIAPAGTPLSTEELDGWLQHRSSCATLSLRSDKKFARGSNAVFAAFLQRAGDRLAHASSHDGRIHRHPPRDFDFDE